MKECVKMYEETQVDDDIIVHCIRCNIMPKDKSWCGEKWIEWNNPNGDMYRFQTLDEYLNHIKAGGRYLACEECLSIIRDLIKSNHELF